MTSHSDELPSALSPTVESRPGLLRVLGPGMAMAMVVGNVIGSGIFFKPGTIAKDAGHFPLIITAWVVGGIVCILGALCFAELAVMLPRAGGLYVYLREAYGRFVAFLFGWSEFLFGRPASIGALSVAFVITLKDATGWKLAVAGNEVVGGVCVSLCVITAMGWINVMGVIWGGRLQAATTIIKAGFLGLLAALPYLVLASGQESFDVTNFSTTVSPNQTTLTTQFAAVMLAVMWAYNGWHGITPIAEEVRNPQRNIPIALFGGIGILIVLYVAANVAYHGVLTMEQVAGAEESVAVTTVQTLLGPFGESIAAIGVTTMSAVIVCSLFGAINSNMLNGPRVSFAMGRDDVFLRPLGRVHVIYRTPAIAITVQAIMAGVLVIVSAVLVETVEAFKERSIFAMLTDYVVFSASIFYALAVLSVIVLRLKHPDWERSYRTLGYPLVPGTYLVFYCWFLVNVFQGNPREAIIGLVLIATGIPVFFSWKFWARQHPENVHDGQ